MNHTRGHHLGSTFTVTDKNGELGGVGGSYLSQMTRLFQLCIGKIVVVIVVVELQVLMI